MIQDQQIYNDALTNLNNRRHLNHFLEERLSKASPERPVTVYMIDINGFKSINDRFGHVEGDNALRFFADVFRDVGSRYNAFIARYGGDEFSLVFDSASVKAEAVVEALNQEIAEKQKTANGVSHQYVLTLSIGYYASTSNEMSSDEAFACADKGFYLQKKAWHKQNDVLLSSCRNPHLIWRIILRLWNRLLF
jgi:diguanylate cyclase (GGDEF) domain